jgi:hypothetical protein
MTSVHQAALEFVAALHPIQSEPEEPAFALRPLVSMARNSHLASEILREIYHLAATGAWKPDLADIRMLVYAPLENPGVIPGVQTDMEKILDTYRVTADLRTGWKWVHGFNSEASGVRFADDGDSRR